MLNMTQVELKLISDPDMYIFFEKGMRDGVSYISNRYSKANNKHLKSYDPKQEPKHYILRHKKFTWLWQVSSHKRLQMDRSKETDLNKYISNGSKDCAFEFDLEYPKELHNDYSLAPDKKEIKRKMLSVYQLKL